MKKILFLLSIITTFLIFSGCQKESKNENNISFLEIQNKIISSSEIENAEIKNLADINTAQNYGISQDDIEEGIVYSTKNESPDKIILVKAKGGPSTENVEKALANEVSGLISFWEDNFSESEKLKNHILKTKNDFVLLSICENYENVEKDFDNFFE